jgi:hypothetical protein
MKVVITVPEVIEIFNGIQKKADAINHECRQQPRNQRGIRKMKVLPWPNADSTQIFPP